MKLATCLLQSEEKGPLYLPKCPQSACLVRYAKLDCRARINQAIFRLKQNGWLHGVPPTAMICPGFKTKSRIWPTTHAEEESPWPELNKRSPGEGPLPYIVKLSLAANKQLEGLKIPRKIDE